MNVGEYAVQRLSGNSELAPLRALTSLRNGAKGYHFGRLALPRNARSDPRSEFPDSLLKLSEKGSE